MGTSHVRDTCCVSSSVKRMLDTCCACVSTLSSERNCPRYAVTSSLEIGGNFGGGKVLASRCRS